MAPKMQPENAPVSPAPRAGLGHVPPSARPALTPRNATNRSRVTNGREVLPGIDQRSAIARRYHDICAAVATDQGGADRLSEARLQLIRRFAAASVLAEAMEAKLAAGEQIDIAEHAQLASTMVRIAQRIGIDRRARNVTPSLREYLENEHDRLRTD
jgi:hypothetical protein